MALSKLSIAADWPLQFFEQATNGASLRRKFGVGGIPSLNMSLALGTGDNQCNWLYWSPARSLAATTTESFDLSGSLTDAFGVTISATKLKLAIVAIDVPDGTKSLRVGPQNVSNAAQLGWGGTGSTVYTTVVDWLVLSHSWGGWTITGGSADLFPVHNPGGSAVTYSILMAGV